MTHRLLPLTLALTTLLCAQTPRWSTRKANQWYAKQPFLVGGNYIPATAINELEMWQGGEGGDTKT